MIKTAFISRPGVRLIALGGLLAGLVWALLGPPDRNSAPPEIVVTKAEIAHQKSLWEKTWGRPPTAAELKQAVDSYVRSEILYREALARRMDRGDPRVRLALVQKMQMLAAGQADAKGVSDQDLASFFALRKEQYRIPARLSIQQVFFKDIDGSEQRINELLERSKTNGAPDSILLEAGDPTMLQRDHEAVTALDLERMYGTDFTAAVLSLPIDEWSGPIRSGYGLHLIYVYDPVPGRIPELAEVRDHVENDLLYEAREAAQDQGFQEIAVKYRITMTDGAKQMLDGNQQ